MNVFDFDGTIYDGDSSIDFWIFCIKRKPALIRYLSRQLSGALFYKLGKISKEEFKSRYFCFFEGISDIDLCVKEFWDKQQNKIKDWYKTIHKTDDCVISASPAFLLSDICSRLDIKNLIATKVDKQTGKLIGKNCHDVYKPLFFRESLGDITIDEFYSDSKSDAPMAKLANKSFLVKNNNILNWS